MKLLGSGSSVGHFSGERRSGNPPKKRKVVVVVSNEAIGEFREIGKRKRSAAGTAALKRRIAERKEQRDESKKLKEIRKVELDARLQESKNRLSKAKSKSKSHKVTKSLLGGLFGSTIGTVSKKSKKKPRSG